MKGKSPNKYNLAADLDLHSPDHNDWEEHHRHLGRNIDRCHISPKGELVLC